MIPKLATVLNFGSFRSLTFSFDSLGLALISGVTGCGKSTLLDILSWCCWGITSKQGAAEDVRRWGADDPTVGVLEVETATGGIVITRIRGKPSQCDLYYTEGDNAGTMIRGANAVDTQKLITERLGIDADLFLIGSYYSQFSSEAEVFFTARSKDRRETLERIADLTTAVKLSDQASEARKIAKKDLETAETAQAKEQGRVEQLVKQKADTEASVAGWDLKQAMEIAAAETKAQGWEAQRIRDIDTAKNKAQAWEGKHERELDAATARSAEWVLAFFERIAAVQRKADHFDFERDAKVAAALQRMEAVSIELQALGALPSPDDALASIEAKRKDIATAKQTKTKLMAQVAEIKEQLWQSQAEHKRISALGDVCPACERPGANPHKKEHVSALEADIESAQNALAFLAEELAPIDVSIGTEMLLVLEQAAALELKAKAERLAAQVRAEYQAAEAAGEAENPYPTQVAQIEAETNPYDGTLKELKRQTNPFTGEVEEIGRRENPNTGALSALKLRANPYLEQVDGVTWELTEAQAKLEKQGLGVLRIQHRVGQLSQCYDLGYALRGELLRNAVTLLERNTNQALEAYFDGAFRVTYSLEGSDKLNVTVTKDGYEVAFKCLSGGERKMLALSHWGALRKQALDKAGVSVPIAMLDEAFSGLSGDLKAKAFRFLEDLTSDCETVLAIEHDAGMASLFDSVIYVDKVNDESVIVESGEREEA